MQARLDQLNARGLELRVGETVRVVLGEMATLRGDLSQEGSRTVVERATATRAEVAALHLRFGTTVIASDAGIVFDELRGSFRNDATGTVRCELQADRADGVRIALAFGLPGGELAISGRAVLTGARLRIEDASGSVFAEQLVLTEVALALAGKQLDVETLEGAHVAIEWGPAGVRVRATSATIGAASGAVEIAAPAASRAEVASDTTPSDASASETPPRETPANGSGARAPAGLLPPAVQQLLPLLDGLAGQLDVDLGLDLTVPVLGQRRATHKFRIPIDGGALDYRKLESDLSTLEDSLLDFAMHGDVLVLERGIPLLPTRGSGKPILRWHVEGEDLALARRNRIRLAMLPQFRTNGDEASTGNGNGSGNDSGTDNGSDGSGSGTSRFALREVSLRNLKGNLRLEHGAPPPALPLRRVSELALGADLHHAVTTQPRDGAASARLAGVELGPMTIALGAMTLGFRAVTLGAADVDAAFAGFQPRAVRTQIRGLEIRDLDLAPGSRSRS